MFIVPALGEILCFTIIKAPDFHVIQGSTFSFSGKPENSSRLNLDDFQTANMLHKNPKNAIIAVSFLVIIILSFLFWKNGSSDNQKEEARNEEMEISEEKESIAQTKEIKEDSKEDLKKQEFTEYQNQTYGYFVKFPDNWHMNNDLSEAKFKEKEIDDEDRKMTVGGQTFWSNYKNINQYTPDNRPQDFHILALTVYQDEKAKAIEDFAKKLGFDDDSQKIPFKTNNLKGIEFVAAGLSKGNPRVAAIFQKDSLFYVFNLGFIGGDQKVAEEMENIIGTFRINYQ